MLYFMLQWAVREIEISNDWPRHSGIYIQPWPPQSLVLCTCVKTHHGTDTFAGDECLHIVNNNMAGGEETRGSLKNSNIVP